MSPQVGVGVVCLRGETVLLVKRAKPPLAGEWSLPGGRVEFGEPVRAAALRELSEETGIVAELGPLLDVVDAILEDRHFVLVDFAARWVSGEPEAGDDAAEARFFPLDALPPLWPETRRIIARARAAA